MDINKEILKLTESIVDFKMVDANDIPKIDLYMEQVISFLEQEMGDSLRREDESVFTNTMINNYTKAGVLPRPENKKYNRRHILTLIYIFMLKQNLPMPDIKSFTSCIENNEQLETMYRLFSDIVEEIGKPCVEAVEKSLDIIDDKMKDIGSEHDDKVKSLTFISLMSFISMVCTALCSQMLNGDKCSILINGGSQGEKEEDTVSEIADEPEQTDAEKVKKKPKIKIKSDKDKDKKSE